MNDIDEIMGDLKHIKEQTPLMVPLNLVLGREHKLLGAVTSPGRRDDNTITFMAALIPALRADEVAMVCECWARHIDSDPAVPISEDPTSQAAILVVVADKEGGFEWRLAPYGLGDDGVVAWHDAVALTSPALDSMRVKLREALNDPIAEETKGPLLTLMYVNGFSMVLTTEVNE